MWGLDIAGIPVFMAAAQIHSPVALLKVIGGWFRRLKPSAPSDPQPTGEASAPEPGVTILG